MSFKKCYFGCEIGVSLHRFPKPIYPNLERFNMWKDVLDATIKECGDEYIYGNVRICHRHFDHCYYTHNNKLTRNAIPSASLCLPLGESPILREREEFGNSANVAQVEPVVAIPSTSHTDPRIMINKVTRNPGVRRDNREILKLQNKLHKMKEKCKSKTQLIRKAERLSKNRNFLKVVNKLPEAAKIFTTMQLSWKKKPRGRRYNIEEQILSLTIYKQSPKAYKFLRRIFTLPSKRTILKLLESLQVDTGLNEFVINMIKDTVNKWPNEKRLCTVMFDEIALSPGLHYNKVQDQIVGFEQHGEFGDGNKIADHALVFMIKGLKAKYKQPICFTFCQSTTKSQILKQLINKIIGQLNAAGLHVVATICDQATTNVSAINKLLHDTKEKYLREGKEHRSLSFEVNGDKVFPIFDPPHLLKGIRNNFIDKEIHFVSNGENKNAKWHHLHLLLDLDVGEHELRLVNKLTEAHVYKNQIPKMKVKHAAQVFSQRVSAALRFLASEFNYCSLCIVLLPNELLSSCLTICLTRLMVIHTKTVKNRIRDA